MMYLVGWGAIGLLVILLWTAVAFGIAVLIGKGIKLANGKERGRHAGPATVEFPALLEQRTEPMPFYRMLPTDTVQLRVVHDAETAELAAQR